MATDSSDRNNTPSNFKDVGQGNPSPSAKVVEDFHRNSDKDHRKESQHHTIGTSRYQAAAGDHVHDGSTGVALLDGTAFSGDVSSEINQPALFQQIITALVNLGAVDTTTKSAKVWRTLTGTQTVNWSVNGLASDEVTVPLTVGVFSVAPFILMTRIKNTDTSFCCEPQLVSAPSISSFRFRVVCERAIGPASCDVIWVAIGQGDAT